MVMTPEQIYKNFTDGDPSPLSDVELETREVVSAYRAASERFAELSNRMTGVWSGDAAFASVEKAQPLVSSLRDSADLLDACAGAHGAQRAAFEIARVTVQPVPPMPDRPTPTEMIKEIFTHGPMAPFEQAQTYRDGVAAYNAAAEQNKHVMDNYYWSTEDNRRIPDHYPTPTLAPDGSEHDVTASGGEPPFGDADDKIETEPGRDGDGGGLDDGGGVGGGGGGLDDGGGVGGGGPGIDGIGGSGPGGAGGVDPGGPGLDGLGGPNDLDGPGDPTGPPPNPAGTNPNWVMSPGLVPDSNVITDPARNPPPAPRTDLPPTGAVGIPGTDSKRDRNTGATVSSGVDPVRGAFDPAGAPPSGFGSNWAGGDQTGRGPGTVSGVGATGSPAPGPLGRTGGGPGRGGMPGGMGMTPMGANREEDKEHTRPEYLFEPDPNAIFGTDQRASSPVIGAAWQPESFDDEV